MDIKDLKDIVLKKNESVWEIVDENEKNLIFDFSNDYKKFLDDGKTERECAANIRKIAIENGFEDIEDIIKKGEKIVPGQKIYGLNRDKSIILFVVGEEDIDSGMQIVGGHIDSPRIDLKQRPLYEDGGMALLKTHYYGGIKKYQWASIPLSIHGTVIKKNGEKLDFAIGEDENDPVFFITDLLPHLGKDQMDKKLAEGITGEGLNVVLGSIPVESKDEKEKIKLNVLKMLNEKYGIVEGDFETAEIEVVPAGKARDVGLDRGLISSYGHDDRVCSYAGFKAVLDIKNPKRTIVGMFMDKEEVGSQGNTGSESRYFENCVAELINLQKESYSDLFLRRSLGNSKVLSADVSAAFDPNFPEVYDKRNTSLIGYGLQMMKYSGARGKSGCNDANAEFLGEVREIFENSGVVWQTGELGKVDQGGGGTIAYILANAGADVVDCGVPVLAMHAPYELISKADLYMAYKGYRAFLIG